MTLIVGIASRDGVVIASDSAATYGATLGQQPVTKVRQLGGATILFASSGSVGMSQVLSETVLAVYSDREFGRLKTPAATMNYMGVKIAEKVNPYFRNASLSASFVGQARAGENVVCSCLVAYAVDGKPQLFRFDPSGAPEHATEQLPFIAIGSGQAIADPFLGFIKRVVWEDRQPTLADARCAAAWTVWHVCKTNPGGVGPPIQMATLTVEGARIIATDKYDFAEHQNAITELEGRVRGYFQQREPAAELPPKVE